MKWTNDVCNKTCKHGAVLLDGSINASSRTDDIATEKYTVKSNCLQSILFHVTYLESQDS